MVGVGDCNIACLSESECPFGAVLNGGTPEPISNFELKFGGQSQGTLKSAAGQETKFTHGDSTCFTDIVGGKLLTFCSCTQGDPVYPNGPCSKFSIPMTLYPGDRNASPTDPGASGVGTPDGRVDCFFGCRGCPAVGPC